MLKLRSQGKDLEELPVNSGVALELYDVPFLLQPANHQQVNNRTLRLQPEASSYLGVKAGILVGVTDVYWKTCRSYQLSNAVIY